MLTLVPMSDTQKMAQSNTPSVSGTCITVLASHVEQVCECQMEMLLAKYRTCLMSQAVTDGLHATKSNE